MNTAVRAACALYNTGKAGIVRVLTLKRHTLKKRAGKHYCCIVLRSSSLEGRRPGKPVGRLTPREFKSPPQRF